MGEPVLRRSPVAAALVIILAGTTARGESPYNIAWIRQFGTTDEDYGYSVAVDGAGNAYISGFTDGSLGGPSAGGDDAFLTKYDSAGNLLWSRQIGTQYRDESRAVALDGFGSVYITGITFGSLSGPNSGSSDAFLTKYDSVGNVLWSRQLGTAGFDVSASVAIDSFGNAFISGNTGGSLGAPNAGNFDAFLTKYDSSGNVLWSRQIGTVADDVSWEVALDGAGNAYIGGFTQGNLAGPNAGNADAFLFKYDTAGSLLWARQIGTPGDDLNHAVAVDGFGNAYISGSTRGSLGGPNSGSDDAFLIKYDSAGNVIWSRQIGTVFSDGSFAVAVDSAANAYISGETTGSLGAPNVGLYDAFLTKYDSAGNVLWSRQIGTTTTDVGYSVSVDAQGNAYIGGYTYGSLGGPNAGNEFLADAFLVKFVVPEPSTFVLAATALAAALCARALRPRRLASHN